MFNCTECELKFISEALLDYHTNVSHNVDDLTTHCKLCVLIYKQSLDFFSTNSGYTELAASQIYEEKDVVFGCNNRNKCAIQFASGHHFTREHKSGGQLFKIKFDNNERYCCFRYM